VRVKGGWRKVRRVAGRGLGGYGKGIKGVSSEWRD